MCLCLFFVVVLFCFFVLFFFKVVNGQGFFLFYVQKGMGYLCFISVVRVLAGWLFGWSAGYLVRRLVLVVVGSGFGCELFVCVVNN